MLPVTDTFRSVILAGAYTATGIVLGFEKRQRNGQGSPMP
jgi:hypothetical protein